MPNLGVVWEEFANVCQWWWHSCMIVYKFQLIFLDLSGNFSSIPIGLHTYASSHHFIGSYKWTDGSTVNYSNWADGQPPDDKHTYCVFIYEGKWSTNIQCSLR